jgi:hypothetical protein
MPSHICAIKIRNGIPGAYYIFKFLTHREGDNYHAVTSDTQLPPGSELRSIHRELDPTDTWLYESLDRKTYIFRPHERDGRICPVSYTCTVYLQPRYLKWGTNIIPIVDFSEAYKSLPYTFYILEHPGHESYESVRLKYTVVAPIQIEPAVSRVPFIQFPVQEELDPEIELGPSPSPSPRLPDCVYRGLMEGALYRKDTCPITFEPFTIENICITPCMHCFDYEALSRGLRSCPLCRTLFDPLVGKANSIIRYAVAPSQ